MNILKKIAVATLLAASAVSASPAFARTYDFKTTVSACTQVIREQVDARFMAYVVNDGTDNHVNMMGTDQGRFVFGGCMNGMGHHIDVTPLYN